jgi:rare lipoprotein A (peptidoglycan hydrolase)
VGSSGKRRPKTPVRSILIATGTSAVVLTATAGALAAVHDNESDGSGTVAQVAPSATAARPDLLKAAPSPIGTGSATPDPSPTETGTTATPKPAKPKAKKKPKYRVVDSGSCKASYYSEGQMTASGERFDPNELTAAHRTLPFGTKVRVTNKSNDRSVIVRINDRGPFVSDRCLDLSKAAMEEVGGTGSGVISVRYEVLEKND